MAKLSFVILILVVVLASSGVYAKKGSSNTRKSPASDQKMQILDESSLSSENNVTPIDGTAIIKDEVPGSNEPEDFRLSAQEDLQPGSEESNKSQELNNNDQTVGTDSSSNQTPSPTSDSNSSEISQENSNVSQGDETNTQILPPQENPDALPEPEGSKDNNNDQNTEPLPANSAHGVSNGLKSLILGIIMLCFVILIAFMCHYRYQLEKYKIPPFTPPRCCPNFLFPRAYDEKRNRAQSEVYQMIEVGDYNPPELSQL